MLTIEQLVIKYEYQLSRGGCCVGGMLCMELMNGLASYPSMGQLSRCLTMANKDLDFYKATTFAARIIKLNDTGKRRAAINVLEDALNWRDDDNN